MYIVINYVLSMENSSRPLKANASYINLKQKKFSIGFKVYLNILIIYN